MQQTRTACLRSLPSVVKCFHHHCRICLPDLLQPLLLSHHTASPGRLHLSSTHTGGPADSTTKVQEDEEEKEIETKMDILITSFQNSFMVSKKNNKKYSHKQNFHRKDKSTVYRKNINKTGVLTKQNVHINVDATYCGTTLNHNDEVQSSFDVVTTVKPMKSKNTPVSTASSTTKKWPSKDILRSVMEEGVHMIGQTDSTPTKQLSTEEKELLINLQSLHTAAAAEELMEEVAVCIRRDTRLPFDLLRRLCAWSCKLEDDTAALSKLLQLTQKMYPLDFEEHLGFKYYYASALCYNKKVEAGLETLLQLYQDPATCHHKKVKDTTTFIINHLLQTRTQHEHQLVLEFVERVAEETGQLSAALSLWTVAFSSSQYRLQQMAEGLIARHSGLLKMLHRKLDGLVKRATLSCDADLLLRLLQFVLHHNMQSHLAPTTSALLFVQSAAGDVKGADETRKFAEEVGVPLSPASVKRFLTLLHNLHQPAPLSLLAVKYGSPPAKVRKPSIPKFKYKF